MAEKCDSSGERCGLLRSRAGGRLGHVRLRESKCSKELTSTSRVGRKSARRPEISKRRHHAGDGLKRLVCTGSESNEHVSTLACQT